MASPTISSRILNNGISIPLIGFGTFAKGRTPGLSYTAIISALNAGYRHLDCAWFYNNEDEIGTAIKDWLTANPQTQRSDLFITTKVWPHLCGSIEDIQWSLDDSLRKLGLAYVDCFLVHWPVVAERTKDMKPRVGEDGKYVINQAMTRDPAKIWLAMEEVCKKGKTRSIGVSNWTVERLEQLLEVAEIKPVVNQVEIHPYFPNAEVVEYCLSKDILPVAYSPLGSQHAIPGTEERLLKDQRLVELAEKKDVSLARLLIAWGLKRGYAILPKSTTADRIKDNLYLTELSDTEFDMVNQATEGKRHRFCELEHIFGYDAWK